tara:strand:+ start:518 stop:1654 length:1137 start_codon:yes stop_codon:yes gene_type:complete
MGSLDVITGFLEAGAKRRAAAAAKEKEKADIAIQQKELALKVAKNKREEQEAIDKREDKKRELEAQLAQTAEIKANRQFFRGLTGGGGAPPTQQGAGGGPARPAIPTVPGIPPIDPNNPAFQGSFTGTQPTAPIPGSGPGLRKGVQIGITGKGQLTGSITGQGEPKAASKAGKEIQDRELFVNQFGKNSPQVKAFDEATAPDKAGRQVKLSDEAELRKEFTKQSKDFVQIRDSFGRITTAAKDPSPAGDLALMFNFMKMLDPASVVRESEFAQVAATGSFGQQLEGAAIKFLRGERLADDVRKDFVDRAKLLFEKQKTFQLELEKGFRGIAKRINIDPKNIIINFVGGNEKMIIEDLKTGEQFEGPVGPVPEGFKKVQ